MFGDAWWGSALGAVREPEWGTAALQADVGGLRAGLEAWAHGNVERMFLKTSSGR